MSDDLKNSILLWVGTLAFFGLIWAALHFDLGPGIPDHWLLPVFGILTAVNVVRSIWNLSGKRKGQGR